MKKKLAKISVLIICSCTNCEKLVDLYNQIPESDEDLFNITDTDKTYRVTCPYCDEVFEVELTR